MRRVLDEDMFDKISNEGMDTTTEWKIKNAARSVFHRKGYAATRTRDIAEEAGINIALLNYYFRSKQKLFELIMFETMRDFLQNMSLVFNDEKTTLEKKVEIMADKYIDFITKEPEIPLFIMSEIRNDPDKFLERLPVANLIKNSVLIKQHQLAVEKGELNEPNVLHFIINMMSLVMFPFIANPMLKKIGNLDDSSFNTLMQNRKKLIPSWIKAMFT
ncbi:TetR/AcrR family transcriptional regulator [Nemorincola caseinilytica]|uniref:TetR/AcrR family transcriptional regulator n=1 Tax=Nemorincola caseinilytica TaxID=2054315 RepID=A0ABP8NKA6_9BACT